MKITVLGNAEHDQWFARRLQARGFAVSMAHQSEHPFTHLAGAQAGPGLLADSVLIDTGPGSIEARHRMAAHCSEAGLGYAELAGQWQALGVPFGFALFVGTDPDTRDALTPLLDALAPQAGAWLPAGPAASARFAAQVFDALSMACALACQAGWSQPGQLPHTPDWGAFFLQQQQLADKLLALSQHYLSLFPDETGAESQDPWQQLAHFSHPPREQEHFSANLARLIVLALSQREAQQAIFTRLMPGAG
ncbi:6-phosphogluconate dehydrogenase [Paludibacterium sp. B53371]|uniref:6-phosphogluconate dehydrogenase n=1 Tax=Paludibacterium sp. B53371 TaxID=2806263 RepID=UPI001C056736|nr:6-phosphogluconate dehydrogenase [Paludibacterium sp. B53371]